MGSFLRDTNHANINTHSTTQQKVPFATNITTNNKNHHTSTSNKHTASVTRSSQQMLLSKSLNSLTPSLSLRSIDLNDPDGIGGMHGMRDDGNVPLAVQIPIIGAILSSNPSGTSNFMKGSFSMLPPQGQIYAI